MKRLAVHFSTHLPFFYGWVILLCACCAGFARQGPAVATLSIFVTPMTIEFNWSKTALSGAVSLGGLLAAAISPLLGPLVDRHGARAILCFAIVTTALCSMLISYTNSLTMFYILFCVARMNFAGPFDLGIYGAVNNWFIRRRPRAISIVTLTQMAGLTSMPLIAYAVMDALDWRAAWIAIGLIVFIVGFFPTFFLMCRRPEDIGLLPDGALKKSDTFNNEQITEEPSFTRSQAINTKAFWLLITFTAMVYPIQAGVSLHQAPHLLERGLSPASAAVTVSIFSLLSGLSAILYGFTVRRFGVRTNLLFASASLGISCILMLAIQTVGMAYLAATLFGIGIGGILCVLPIIWADYFGRGSFSSIRGIVLTVQISSQAAGPIISGLLWDWNKTYEISLLLFTGMSILAAIISLIIKPPNHLLLQTTAREKMRF
ncbi:MAG: MFS transporter [Rhodospirillaceae bacterium]|nr:MFS transporter [Rhodospirillaceae bacterium]